MLYSKIEGSGEPLLILHGFLGMSDNWRTLGSRFAQNNYQVHLLDLRNHGRSFHSDEFDYFSMAEDVREYCIGHGLREVNVIGHSMGGKVAMTFAGKYPELLRKLIVADIAPRYYSPHHEEILDGLASIDFSLKPERSQVEEQLRPFIAENDTLQFLLKSLYWKEPGQLAFRFNVDAFNKNRDLIGQQLDPAIRFDKPVLFLKGANSRYIQEKDTDNILRHFPSAQIIEIPAAGHWLHAENPDAVLQEVLEFLK